MVNKNKWLIEKGEIPSKGVLGNMERFLSLSNSCTCLSLAFQCNTFLVIRHSCCYAEEKEWGWVGRRGCGRSNLHMKWQRNFITEVNVSQAWHLLENYIRSIVFSWDIMTIEYILLSCHHYDIMSLLWQ